MIPRRLQLFLEEHLPAQTIKNRLIKDSGQCFLEFGPLDVDRLLRLGIKVDAFGPYLVVALWDELSPIEIGGYLVVDNLSMGHPSMGGIRMLPEVTPSAIFNLARGMTLKNAAADLPYGGGKSGIVSESGLSQEQHTQVIKGFAHLLYRYRDIYLPGPDVGTNDVDMKTIAIESGIDCALSKTVDMGGNRIDQLGAAAGGVIIALDELLKEMPRLASLTQFSDLSVPSSSELTVLVQGFGAVGANAAGFLCGWLPGAQVVGISDELGYLYCPTGLPIEELFAKWKAIGPVSRTFFQDHLARLGRGQSQIKFSNAPNDLLRESAFCLIPAAPVVNYLDLDWSNNPSMVVAEMGHWHLIVEGANTYSPDPERKASRSRMERVVYREHGVLIAADFLVNSGGVIFAAQEHLIKTPQHLRIPTEMLGHRDRVEAWLKEHSEDLAALAEERRVAAEIHREEIIRRNIRELIDILLSDTDMLPCEAAERISIRRIAAREFDRTAVEIMEPIPTINLDATVQQAAASLVQAGCPILAIITDQGELAGVITEWDITRATATGSPDDLPINEVMTRQVITANPQDSLVELIRKLEYHEISALPVVNEKKVTGMVSSDLLARKSLMRLLQSQTA